MPELPEVETVTRFLRGQIKGFSIRRLQIRDPRLAELFPSKLRAHQLAGARIADVARRGKYFALVFEQGGCLVFHLGMSGHLRFWRGREPRPFEHERLRLQLSGRRGLALLDPRRFGRVWYVRDLSTVWQRLGPDALGVSLKTFEGIVCSSRRRLKALLMDQSRIAGIGNIYADEALWRAGLNPFRASSSLTQKEIRRLWRSIKSVLKRAIAAGGTSLGDGAGNYELPTGERGQYSNFLAVYGREGERCQRCRGIIQRKVLGQRSTYFCPQCQP